MAERTLKTRIGLRRDTETNYELVKNTLIPIKGEICLVDTSEGLKVKVGNGKDTFANLPYCALGENSYDADAECLNLF
jgi:hypothetical protein